MGGKEESVDEAGRQRRAETGMGGGRNVQGVLFGISVCFWVKITTLRNRKIENNKKTAFLGLNQCSRAAVVRFCMLKRS